MIQVLTGLMVDHSVQLLVLFFVSMFVQMVHHIWTILVLQVLFHLSTHILVHFQVHLLVHLFIEYFMFLKVQRIFFFAFWRVQVFMVPLLVQVSVQVLASTFISPQVQFMILQFVTNDFCCYFGLSQNLLLGIFLFLFPMTLPLVVPFI